MFHRNSSLHEMTMIGAHPSLPAVVDVAVVGLGALGAATLWRLAERGVNAIGIDQYIVPHAQGSTHGKTRLFRTICLEHPELGHYARLSRDLFRELEAHAGETLLDITGGVMIGSPRSHVIQGTMRAAERLGVNVSTLDADEIAARYPQHKGLSKDEIAILDPEAGLARPEAFVAAAIARAEALGTPTLQGVRVISITESGSQLKIEMPGAVVLADQIVVAAGVWLETLVPNLPLDPIRTTMTWFSPSDGFDLEQFPVFIREISSRLLLWGHGSLPGGDIKIGLGDIGVDRLRVDPMNIDRGIRLAEIAELENTMARYMRNVGPAPSRMDACVINRTPDEQFLIGRVPTFGGHLIVVGGDNGHAFKHAPAIGETAAAITLFERPKLAVDFVDPLRFRI